MGKKNTISITENERSGKPKATWNDDLVAIFCEICVKEVAKGNRPGTHFDKIGWMNVEYQKFRDVGISPDMMDMYDKMFKSSVAVGNCVMIPSSTIPFKETVGDSEHDKQTVNKENEEAS
ncbi:hypothetical protein LWI29_024144 [Acer saccharum]|uniref:Myb/SANT-like domain-containing protein n=1 Tax=Acer saccharum TaxID=4024 RepID=A0AA39VCG0_ACESA|nr:hypothetical protein LWI29_024144 [Acer saccharum]